MKSEIVRIIGVPLDLGADRKGVDMGPDAMRCDGLIRGLEALGLSVEDSGNLAMPPRPQGMGPNPKLKYYDEIMQACAALRYSVSTALEQKRFPLIIGGDHSITIGTAAALSQHYRRIGMLWIDAHGDFNTESTTISGNIHGMSFATAIGMGTTTLVDKMGVPTTVQAENCVLIGARDLDPLEQVNLKKSGVTVFTMREIDEQGMFQVVRRALEIATNGTDAMHLSFDLDSMDPVFAPGVGTPVIGGISYREAHLLTEMVADSGRLTSMEVVELNPILDRRNETGKLAISLVLSALGKRIF